MRQHTCIHEESCRFLAGKIQCEPCLLAIYRRRYCHGDYTSCARYRAHQLAGVDLDTLDLYPNQDYRLAELSRPHRRGRRSVA